MLIRSVLISLVVVPGLVANVTGQAQQDPTTMPSTMPAATRLPAVAVAPANVRIGKGDVISLTVLNGEELSKDWVVDANGDLTLPMLGKVHVAGMTPEEVASMLTERLQRYFVEPQVAVHMSEFRSQPVTVTGAVAKPGIVQLAGAHTLFQAIVLAGGFRDDFGPTVTVTRPLQFGEIHHPGATREEQDTFVSFPTSEILQGRGPAASFPIQTFDVIEISSSKQRIVQVTGEVTKPGNIELAFHDNISLLHAISMAGGVTRTAAAKRVMVIHKGARDRATTSEVNLAEVIKGKVSDPELNDGDIVIVPSQRQLPPWLQGTSTAAVTSGVYVLLGRF